MRWHKVKFEEGKKKRGWWMHGYRAVLWNMQRVVTNTIIKACIHVRTHVHVRVCMSASKRKTALYVYVVYVQGGGRFANHG